MITISQFKDILTSKAGGKPLSKVPNFYSMLFQAMIALKGKTDIPSAIRTVQLTNPVYTAVEEYAIPSDVSLGAIINVRPIVADDTFYDFDRLHQRQYKVEQKYGLSNRYAIRNQNGIQYLNIGTKTTSPLTINQCESLTANGTVGALGVTTNLQADTLQKISGSGSISFQTGVGATNGIEIVGQTAVNISAQNDILAYVYLPSITNVTGITLRLGQSSSAYYAGTVTADFFGNALAVGWNLIKIARTSLSIGAGSPNLTAVTYFACLINGTIATAIDGFRVDSVVGQVGAIFEMDYYSGLQFQSITGTRLSIPTAESDTILLTDDELDLFLGYLIEIMAVDIKQMGATIDVQEYGGGALIQKTADFKLKYPSQRQLARTNYGYKPYIN